MTCAGVQAARGAAPSTTTRALSSRWHSNPADCADVFVGEAAGDPYNAGGLGGALDEFVAYWLENEQAVERDLAHFLCGKPIGGGVARSIGGLCDYAEAFCVSGVYGVWPYPDGGYTSNRPDNWDLFYREESTGDSTEDVYGTY